MKKLILLLLIALGIGVSARAASTYSRDEKVLPKTALTTLANNFTSKVSLIKIDTTLGIDEEYEVILTDGTEISFDREGNWLNVEASIYSSVPSGFILEGISSYVKANHPGARIIGIERDGYNFEITLSDGKEIEFSGKGDFIKYED